MAGSLSEGGRTPSGAGVLGLARRTGVRLLGALFVVWAVVTLVFFGLRLIPGDPAEAILGGPGSRATPEALAAVRAEYGLDQPLFVQYLSQLVRLASGELGHSYALRTSVSEIILDGLGNTLLLAFLPLVLAWAIAIGLALWSTRRSRIASGIATTIEIVAAAVPQFWLGIVLILIFSVSLGWLPSISTGTPIGMVLPVLTLALPLAGFLGQAMRESLLNALDEPFILSARARGESETGIRLVHALRHAALPAISLSGWAFGTLISGAVVVETVFARPGLGRSLLSAVIVRDIPVIVGIVIVSAVAYIIVTIITELADRIADPRLRSA